MTTALCSRNTIEKEDAKPSTYLQTDTVEYEEPTVLVIVSVT